MIFLTKKSVVVLEVLVQPQVKSDRVVLCTLNWMIYCIILLILEHCVITGEIVWNNELISQVFSSGSNTAEAAAAISDAGTSGYAQ